MCSSPQWISPQISPFTTPHAWGLPRTASLSGSGPRSCWCCLVAPSSWDQSGGGREMPLCPPHAPGDLRSLSPWRDGAPQPPRALLGQKPCYGLVLPHCPSCSPLLILVLGAAAAASCPSPSCLGSSPMTIRHFPVRFLFRERKAAL